MSENLIALWQACVRQDPDAAAVIDGADGRTWSRAELDAASDRWLASAADSGRLERRRVALAEPNSAGWLAVFIGLLKAGAVVVPLDPAEPSQAAAASARGAGASGLWRQGRWQELPEAGRTRRRDLCLVKLTSGSTGQPQPLLFTHAQMIADGRQVCSSMGIGPDDLNLGVIPFGHSYGLGNLVVPLLIQGTPILAAASPLPSALAADCARWKPSVFPAVPTLLRALVMSEAAPGPFASLRLIISAGAPLAPETAADFTRRFGRRVHSFYGSSETGGITFDRTGHATLLGRSVGTPLDGVTVTMRPGGRFTIASAAVKAPGRHSPADLGRLDERGELVLLGRTGRTAKIGGRRIDLGEIEKLLRAVPGVADAAAIAHPSRPDALAAAVAATVDAITIRQVLRSRAALWKIPERIVVLSDLPRTSRGKTDRKKVQELLAG